MSHTHRFYVPDLARQPERVELPEEERHHALHVLRVRKGQRIQLFDGKGRSCDGEVAAAGRRELSIVRGPLNEEPTPDPRLTLGQAWLNHERSMESVIGRGTELGVDRFDFFRAQNSERAPRGEEKWMRWAVESCKQCGRNRLPVFSVNDDLQSVLAETSGSVTLIATQHAEPEPVSNMVNPDSRVLLLIGPEGDFAPEEVEGALQCGARAVSLGPYTLRSEIAAAVAVAIVQYRLGRLGC